jgi:hypothetical protein
MRALIAALALFAVPCAWAEDPVDEREAALREIEYRPGKFFEGREKMRASVPGLAADLRPMACKAANATMSNPEMFKILHKKIAFLDKPKNFSQLTPDQVERLTKARALVDEMERDPGIDCTKI